MIGLPPLDLHAHIEVGIDPGQLEALKAVVFAVTRSLEEAREALQRDDRTTVWGVGCHPALESAQRDFSKHDFGALVDHTAFVGELGLDRKARVPLARQSENFRSALEILTEKPRIISVHSYGACKEVLDEIERASVKGAVLHWWLGDERLTQRAIQLGCWFSINAAQARRAESLRTIPLDRLLTETDHPFGDRRAEPPRRPGRVREPERALAEIHAVSADVVRRQGWDNLERLVLEVGCWSLLPQSVRAHLAALA